MNYSDLQMIIASQIAYMDIPEGCTVGEYIQMEMENSDSGRVENIEKLQNRINELSPDQRAACENWVIRDVNNDQHGSGMYACMIDTGEGDAIIAFRGSESDNWENKIKDWGLSDFGLLNSAMTPQQKAAEKYVRKLYKKYGGQYGSFAMTGHSLGGNLAAHATITAPDGMKRDIDQCVNLDGPGFSERYLNAHEEDIKKTHGVLTHYQWSIVGSLLNPVPGENYVTTEAETLDKGSALLSLGWRHDTYSVKRFDENGNMIPGIRDPLATWANPFSKGVDFFFFIKYFPVYIAKDLVYKKTDALLDGLQNMWEKWDGIRVSGREMQLEMYPARLLDVLDRISGISAQIQNLSSNIERIGKQIAIDSLTSGYVKARLWLLAGSIENNGKRLNKYYEQGCACSRCCMNYDRKAAENYRA